jgi:hypothetical protein
MFLQKGVLPAFSQLILMLTHLLRERMGNLLIEIIKTIRKVPITRISPMKFPILPEVLG